jgi:hypothetical protein
MSAEIIPLVRPESVDEAWKVYAALCDEVSSNPHLLVDREHCQRRIRAHVGFQKLYLADCQAPDNLVPFRRPR